MEQLKLNEEQAIVAKELFTTAKDLKQKYEYMHEAFEVTSSKMEGASAEEMKRIREETEQLKGGIMVLISRLEDLGAINVYSDGEVPAYPDAISFLIGIYSAISEIAYELGRVEGYSAGKIATHRDITSLKMDYNKLKKNMLA